MIENKNTAEGMTKADLLNLSCQLSHELSEWNRTTNPTGDGDHYTTAKALLYQIQSGIAQMPEQHIDDLTSGAVEYD